MRKLTQYIQESLINESINNINELFGSLQYSAVGTWIKHLNSDSYKEHVILDEYYKGIPELVDTLIEHWMSIHGKVGEYTNVISCEGDAIQYLERLRSFAREGKALLDEDELQGDLDNIIGLMDTTLYKLKEL